MKETTLKGISVTALAAVGAYFRELGFPLVLLVSVMMLDYISGMVKAWFTRTLSSKTGMRGIVKKLCYMLAVAVAVIVDFVIQLAAERTSIDLTGCYFCATLVMVWLILNECISILENAAAIGVPVPEFLLRLIKRLKNASEPKDDKEEKKEGDDVNKR